MKESRTETCSSFPKCNESCTLIWNPTEYSQARQIGPRQHFFSATLGKSEKNNAKASSLTMTEDLPSPDLFEVIKLGGTHHPLSTLTLGVRPRGERKIGFGQRSAKAQGLVAYMYGFRVSTYVYGDKQERKGQGVKDRRHDSQPPTRIKDFGGNRLQLRHIFSLNQTTTSHDDNGQWELSRF